MTEVYRAGMAPARARLCAGSAIGLAMVLAMPAFAQQAESAQSVQDSSSDEEGLKEIVVTATKVETNVQRTPISVSVYGGADLLSQGVRDITSLGNIAPGVNITGNSGGGTIVAIRGISSRDTTEIGDPAVAISTDGFYTDRSYAIGLAQYDLDRIEVLKGPQGTLFGRNATGGAINIITAKPKNEFGAYATAELGNYRSVNTEGAINVPLTNWLAARLSFSTQDRDGYRNAGANGRFDDQNSRSVRAQIQARPTDDLTIHFLAQRTTQRSNPQLGFVTAYRIAPDGFIDHSLPAIGSSKNIPAAGPGRLNLTDNSYRWDVTYNTSFLNFTYLGGYDNLKWDQLTPNFTFAQPNATLAQATLARYNQTEHPKTKNHEFRVASADQNAPLTFQAGLFYFENTNALASFNRTYPAETNVISFIYDIKFKSFSYFGQASYKILDNLKITGGARHNDDKKTRAGNNFQGYNPALVSPTNPNGYAAITTGGGRTEAKKWTYHAGLDWQVAPANLVYAKYDTGYKAAGFTDISAYGPENVKTAEIGTKNRFFDNKVQFNLSAYRTIYSGQQVNTIVVLNNATPPATSQRTVNAGKSKIWGIEAQAVAALPIGRVDLSVDYLHARFTDFLLTAATTRYVNGAFTSPLVNYNLAGNRPPNAPTWTIAAGYEKSFDAFGGKITPRGQIRYASSQQFTFFNYASDRQKGYQVTNFTLNYKPTDGNWEIEGYLRNAFNTKAFSNASENDRGRNYAYTFIAPQTYGARATVRF